MRLLCGIILIAVAVSITSCSKEEKDSLITRNNSAPAEIQSQNDNETRITDISNWSHPTKRIFVESEIEIKKIIIKDNRTYPIFYVCLPSSTKVKDKYGFEYILNLLAKNNGFWDFSIIDEAKNIKIEVCCDRTKKCVKNIKYIDENEFFQQDLDNQHTNSIDRIKINIDKIGEIIKNTFGKLPSNYYVDCDHMEDMKGKLYYVLHGYESVVDNQETGEGHTATWGWYYVDAVDGLVYKYDLADKAIEVGKKENPKVIDVSFENTTCGWRLLSDRLYSLHGSFLWQVNNAKAILQKIDMHSLKVVKEISINDTYIDGEIISLSEIYQDDNIPKQLFVAVKKNDKFGIYRSVKDDKFRYFREKDDSGYMIGKINSMNFWVNKEVSPSEIKAHINYGEIVLEKNGLTDPYWIDLTKEKGFSTNFKYHDKKLSNKEGFSVYW